MKRIFLSALPAILPLSAYADLPLTIEDMMTDKGKWKLETSITYLNSETTAPNLPHRFTSKPAPPRLFPFRPKSKKTAAIPICSSAHSVCATD